MHSATKLYYEKRGHILVKNLRNRHFDACYCEDSKAALAKALEWIPEDASIGWGGATSAQQIGLLQALKEGGYRTLDRDTCKTPEERMKMMKK